jgi:4-hydroxymandelate oxidase
MQTAQSLPVNLFEMERLAQEKLAQPAFDYYISGANDEITVRENHAAYERIQLAPRMLIDVSQRDMSTTVLGQKVSMPILIAPTAFQRMAHPDGEVASTRAAGKAGTIMTLSTLANSSIEEVAAAASGPLWFQLYVYKDRKITASLVQRAEAAGFSAIVFTVDSPLLGRRERDVKNRFHLPNNLSVKNLMDAGLAELPSDIPDSGLAAYIASLYDTGITWKDVEWLRGITKLPILLKGILRPDDARKAVECGAHGIIVSNHGGRQLDTVPATITALPAIVDAVADKAEVLVDGGIRRGTDVMKAIAFGARAVLVGRPILWGLALDGEHGAGLALELLRQELDLAMALAGCPSISHITRDLIYENNKP